MDIHGIAIKAVAGFKLVILDVPETYEKSTGIAVNLSHEFAKEIHDVWLMRGSYKGCLIEVVEEDNDRYSERKFILRVKYPSIGFVPTGKNSVPEFKGETCSTAGASAGVVEGTVSRAEFKGRVATTDQVSGGIPSGVISEPEFKGRASQTSFEGVGIPQGDVSQAEFIGEPLGQHVHFFHGEQPKEYPRGTPEYEIYRIIPQSPKGKLSSEHAGTPRGKITKTIFQGQDMGVHAHSVPAPEGHVSAPDFKGLELEPHAHSVEIRGEITAQIFEGKPLPSHTHDVVPKGEITESVFIGDPVSPGPAVEIEDGADLRKLLGRTISLGVIGV